MEYFFGFIFLLSFVVWVLFTRIGKGGIVDKAYQAGILEINGFNKDLEDKERR